MRSGGCFKSTFSSGPVLLLVVVVLLAKGLLVVIVYIPWFLVSFLVPGTHWVIFLSGVKLGVLVIASGILVIKNSVNLFLQILQLFQENIILSLSAAFGLFSFCSVDELFNSWEFLGNPQVKFISIEGSLLNSVIFQRNFLFQVFNNLFIWILKRLSIVPLTFQFVVDFF